MSTVSMFIKIEDRLNEQLSALARQNRRSKRMEVMAALDWYVKTKEVPDANTVGTDKEAHPE